tara:strand:+ start:709 stop:1026 length:318 start_codon:yes stop_codon:yes gene_type:complete
MANTIILKNSSTASAVPVAGDLTAGELAVNTADRKLFTKTVGGVVVQVGGGATGSGADDVFYENTPTVTADYTITTGKNAMTTGPLTVNSGITVTVPTGSRLVIL